MNFVHRPQQLDLPKWREIERGLGRQLPRITPDGEQIKPTAPRPAAGGVRKRSGSFGTRRRTTVGARR